MQNFKIFNKSSVKMLEIADNSVDLIIAGPPYNIGTKYGNNNDTLSFVLYKKCQVPILLDTLSTIK